MSSERRGKSAELGTAGSYCVRASSRRFRVGIGAAAFTFVQGRGNENGLRLKAPNRVHVFRRMVARNRLNDHPGSVLLENAAHMLGAPSRITHVVKAIETGDEVEVSVSYFLGGCRDELDPLVYSVGPGMAVGLGDRRLVKIVANEARIGVGLSHQNCREAHAATHVGHLRACEELLFDAIERREPVLHNVIYVSWAEERAGGAKQTARGITPSHTGARAKACSTLGSPSIIAAARSKAPSR